MSKTAGLRTEILTTITLLMGAALLLGGVLMLRLTEQSLLEQKISQLRMMSETIGLSLSDSYRPQNPQNPFSLSILNRLPQELQHQGWWLHGADLQLLSSFRNGNVEPSSADRRQQIRLLGQSLEVIEFPSLLEIFSDAKAFAYFAQPLYHQERFVGLLEINYSLKDIRYRLLLSQRLILVYVLLYGSVLVFIGYYLLQRNVIKPARDLLQATEEVSRGHLETRLPVAGPLEIAQLADAYNHMVEALQESRRESQSHIASLEETNQELQRTRDELIRSEKMSTVGQLAAGLAHELGNPLAALIGYLEVLKTRVGGNPEQDILQRSLDETQRIDYLVRELLDYSRPTETAMEQVNPLVELKKCLDLLGHQGALAGIDLVVELPDCTVTVLIDPQKLQQVLINLLLNAVQACGEQGQVTVSAELDAEWISLAIADNGCGIRPQQLSKIFDPFFTTKEPGKGTGLGLSICQRIVAEVGGKITVESSLGKGSVFRIIMKKVLPVK